MSTFKRSASSAQSATLPGTKPSVHNGQLLISSGLAELDSHLGGGIPLGSLILLFEDNVSTYSNHILNYFISEGVASKHHVVYMGLPSLENALPFNHSRHQLDNPSVTPTSAAEKKEEMKKEEAIDLKISWRYEKYVQDQIAMKQLQSSKRTVSSSSRESTSSRKIGSVQCHEYDLSKTIQKEVIQEAKDANLLHELAPNQSGKLKQFLELIQKNINVRDHVTRIAIRSMQLSGLDRVDSQHFNSITQFLHVLRILCRKSLTTCFITLPKNHSDILLTQSIKNVADIVMRMESFVGDQLNVSAWEMSEYTGLYHIEKLPRMNTLAPYLPDTLNYAFKVKRRKMYIERMSAPPEESRSATVKDRPRYKEEESHSSGTTKSKLKDLEF